MSKRVLLFLGFVALGTGALLHLAGGLEGTRREVAEPTVPVQSKEATDAPSIAPGVGIPEVRAGQGVTQMAPPRRVVWKDKLSDESITIDSFFPWRFKTSEFKPLPMADGVKQGVLCQNVVFELYREPATRAEALELSALTGQAAYATLLHQRFEADEARVFGRLGEALARTKEKDSAARALGDTMLRFTGHVVIEDRAQSITIRGEESSVLTVWPEQGRAVGQGPFQLSHEALELGGTGLTMERDPARDYGRITIQSNPHLHIRSEGRDAKGQPIFDFGPGGFRPVTVRSAGRAIVVREERRREIVLTVSFRDDVTGKQEGGGSLHAGRAELVATKGLDQWRMQRFEADEGVNLEYPGRTRKGERYVATVTAKRLVHEVPETGEPTSVFEGFPVITMRGELSILGSGGHLQASCRDRAWIAPLPPGAPDGGLPRDALQQIGLRGDARIERHVPGMDGPNDALEGESIDLVMWPQERGAPNTPGESRMIAVYFAAVGDVRVDGTTLSGATHRLVAEDLHTSRPRITAQGPDTHFSVGNLGSGERLLGAEPGRPDAAAAPGDGRAAGGRWRLRRMLAHGQVDIATSLGGPALGIPATLQGDEVSYDGLSNRAQVLALGPAPARIGWSASTTQASFLETRELTLDRAAGRLMARGGVAGEIYVQRGGTGTRGFDLPGTRDIGPDMTGAVLTVRTDERLDIVLARNGTATEPAAGQEQTLRIAGPVTTELRSGARVVDRMRSDDLEVVLAYETTPDATQGADLGPSYPTSRAEHPRRSERPTALPDATLEKIEIHARTLRVDLDGKVARFLEADGDVDLSSADDHVEGARLTYDGASRRVEVHAGARPARVLLGRAKESSEVLAERLVLIMQGGTAQRLEAHAPPGGTSTMELYRRDAKRPGQVEWFSLTYEGTLSMTNELLTSERVRVIRRLREPGQTTFGGPIVLRAPTLRILGDAMLAGEEARRVIREILAEDSGTDGGGEVNFQSGEGATLAQVWGHRFRFDVAAQRAILTGRPGRDVRIAYGDEVVTDHTELRIDLASSIPTYSSGSRIRWRPSSGSRTPSRPK